MMASATDRRFAAILAAAALAAILLRTVAIDRLPGINGDEAWYGVNAQELLAGGTPFLRTGIGNPLNPLHSAPVLALTAMFEPSAVALRAPEIVLGILAVLLCYPLLRRSLGDRAALIATVLLAVSPTAVAYSRLGWDPSGGPLMTLLAIACALADRPVLATMAVALAWWVHPTNVFVVPVVAGAWMPHAIDRWRAATPERRTQLAGLSIAGLVVAIPLAIWAAIRVAGNPQTSLPSVSMVIDRVTSPALWAARAWGFVNLASGVSPVLHISGPLSPTAALAANLLTTLIPIAAAIIGFRNLAVHRYARWLIAGLIIAFAGFHVVAMDVALTPTSERYGIFMLVPMIIVCALTIDAATARYAIGGHAAFAAGTLLMVTMVIGGYFAPLWVRGGDAMTTYRTGAREPKLAAYEFIAADSRNSQAVTVVADGWWLYWTLRYFAGPNGRIHVDVVPGSNMPGGTHPPGTVLRPVPPPQRTYYVAFAGSELPAGVSPSAAKFTAFDPIGRPILLVFETP